MQVDPRQVFGNSLPRGRRPPHHAQSRGPSFPMRVLVPEAMAMLPYTIVATQTVAVAVQAIDQNGCVVAPTYPIGNKPGSYNNNVFLWKSDINPPQMLPWFTAAFASAAMV